MLLLPPYRPLLDRHGVEPIDPATLDNLEVFLDGRSGFTVDGSNNVTRWDDQSAHGRNFIGVLSESFPGLYVAGEPAGANSVLLENGGGGRSYRGMEDSVWGTTSASNGITVYYYARLVQKGAELIGGWQCPTGGNLGSFVIYDNSSGAAYYSLDSGAQISLPSPDTTDYHVYALALDHAALTASAYTDGTLAGAGDWSGGGITTKVVLQNVSLGTSPDSRVQVAGFIVYAALHSPAQIAGVTRWLTTVYGVR